MFIAMNWFQVIRGAEAEFETVWTSRDTHLRDVPGFIAFHLLRGPEHEDHTLFASHTLWASRAAFEDWTKSEAFRLAHRGAAATSHCISGIRISRASTWCRRLPPADGLARRHQFQRRGAPAVEARQPASSPNRPNAAICR